jgi:dipeptidyl aminopeptidase/acylaminoacyl peptidase
MDDDAGTAVKSRGRVAVGDLYGIRYGSDAQIANDGSRVAFVLTEVVRGSDGYISTVCEVDREGKSLARIESGTIPRYAADSQALVAARGSDLWLVGGTSRLVGRLPGTIREISWCPVGGRLAVIADVPVEDHAIASTEGIHHITRGRYRIDGEGFDYGHRTQVLVVDLQSGAVSPVTHEQFGATGVTWSPDGERLAYIVPVGDPDTSWEREITVHSLSTGQRALLPVKRPGT